MIRYQDYTVEILKQKLRKRGLKVSGRKAELVQRLEEDDKRHGNIPEGNNVDHRGPDDIPNENTGSSPTAEIPVALETHNIYLKHYCLEESDQYADCEMVQQLFKLVWHSRNIRFKTFGRELQGSANQSDNKNKAERSYDLHLKARARKLANGCNDTELSDGLEAGWIQFLTPRVFRSIIPSEADEDYSYTTTGHCLACRCDFPPGSRAQAHSTRITSTAQGSRQRSDIKFCGSTDRHFNLPNCGYRPQLSYHDGDGKVTGKKSFQRPDTTFGLCTYNLNGRGWTKEWLENDMVKLFEKKALKETMDGFPDLQELYKIGGTPNGIYSYPMFAFGLWEAKREILSSHEDTIKQSARKLRDLLSLQRKIFDKSKVGVTSPTVWFFSSIGADWRVYGCSETKAIRGDGFEYPMVHLWSGVSKGEDSALQLLCIVDLIRFWVDYTYKPLIGTCISRLKAMKACRPPPPLKSTLWRLQISVDREQTPWIFSQRRLRRSSSAIRPTNNLGIPPHGSSRGHSRSSRQSLRPESRSSSRRDHRSPTPGDEQFVMPEKDDFHWLLDRDPGFGDLILIRVSEIGEIMRPAIIHSTSRLVGGRPKPTLDWNDDGFNAVIADESRGHRSKIASIFREDKRHHDYLWQCYQSRRGLIGRGVQFSIILPVNVVSYGQQNPKSQCTQLFEPLELLFRLHDLLEKIDKANKKWCSCGRQKNEYSPPMVQCRRALCDIGWFHKECVGFKDSDDEASWVCDDCYHKLKTIPEQKCAYIELEPTESTFFARESHKRTHLARAIEDVWYKHDWPSQDEILAKLDETADNVDIIESAPHEIHKSGVPRVNQLPRYWATSKDDPKNLILACSRKEGLLYHEEVSDGGDRNGTTDSEEDSEEEIEDCTDEDESSQPKTSEARGRSKTSNTHQTIYVETDTDETDIDTGSQDDTLVSVEGFRTPNKTAKYGHSGQTPAIRLKHI